jgi:hypothetical protein
VSCPFCVVRRSAVSADASRNSGAGRGALGWASPAQRTTHNAQRRRFRTRPDLRLRSTAARVVRADKARIRTSRTRSSRLSLVAAARRSPDNRRNRCRRPSASSRLRHDRTLGRSGGWLFPSAIASSGGFARQRDHRTRSHKRPPRRRDPRRLSPWSRTRRVRHRKSVLARGRTRRQPARRECPERS